MATYGKLRRASPLMECLTTRPMLRGRRNLSELFFSKAFGLTLTANLPVPGLTPQSRATSADARIWLDAEKILQPIDDLPAQLWYTNDRGEEGLSGSASGGSATASITGCCTRTEPNFSSTGRERRLGHMVRIVDARGYRDLSPRSGNRFRAAATRRHLPSWQCGGHRGSRGRPRGSSRRGQIHASRGVRALRSCGSIRRRRRSRAVGRRAPCPARLPPAPPVVRFGRAPLRLRGGPALSDSQLGQTRARSDQEWLLVEERSLPLAAVYVLDDRSDRREPHIENLKGRERLRTLLANTHVGYLLDAAMRKQEFAVLGRLAASVPVRRLFPSDDPLQLCLSIIKDCEALGCTASPTTGR